MNRRRFLQLGAAAAAGFALDPERLLWRPGAKTIFLPPARTVATLDVVGGLRLQRGDIITITDSYGHPYYAVNPQTRQATRQLQTFIVTSDCTGPTVEIATLRPHVDDNAWRGGRRGGKAQPLFVGDTVAEGVARTQPDGSWEAVLTPRDRGWSHKRT